MVERDENAEWELPEPRGHFPTLLRRLAEAAMNVTHHDAAAFEPGYRNEVKRMEADFRPLVRGYLSRRKPRPTTPPGRAP